MGNSDTSLAEVSTFFFPFGLHPSSIAHSLRIYQTGKLGK